MVEAANPTTVRKPLAIFDTAVIAVAATLIVAALAVPGNGLRLVAWVAAAATAAVAATAALMLSRSNRGVFLTPTLRVLLIIAAAGSLGVLTAGRPIAKISSPPPPPDAAVATAMFDLQAAKAAVEGELAAKTEETRELRVAIEKSGTERDEALRRANERLIETERLRQQERERLQKNNKAELQPPPTQKSEPPTETHLLATAWNIPEEQVQSQRQTFERDPSGRNVVEAILGKAPLIGPALGSLFGGGRIRPVTVRVVETLQGGTIPAETDLANMFLATDKPADLTAELFALVNRGEASRAMSKETAAAIKREIEAIRNAVALPVSSDAQKARDTIAKALAADQPCSVDLTSPNFVKFASIAEKRKLIATTTDEAIKNCLDQYPPTGSTLSK